MHLLDESRFNFFDFDGQMYIWHSATEDLCHQCINMKVNHNNGNASLGSHAWKIGQSHTENQQHHDQYNLSGNRQEDNASIYQEPYGSIVNLTARWQPKTYYRTNKGRKPKYCNGWHKFDHRSKWKLMEKCWNEHATKKIQDIGVNYQPKIWAEISDTPNIS